MSSEYEATNIWPKLGFHVVGEIPGRSKSGSTLTVWWLDFGHPTLFTHVIEQRTQSKLAVVIDANIFYDLIEPPTTNNQLSHSLLSDWLDIELCLTNEINTEINRSNDQSQRKRNWASVNEFVVVNSENYETQSIISQLRNLFPENMSDNDESDLRQIAKTVAADIQFFITNDRRFV